MRLALSVILSSLALAQAQDGRPLLEAVARNFQNLKSIHLEGHIDEDPDVGLLFFLKTSYNFTIDQSGPGLRFNFRGGESFEDGFPMTLYCDGAGAVVYHDKLNSYERLDSRELNASCSVGTLSSFQHLADNLLSAAIVGTGHGNLDGKDSPCLIVEAKYRRIDGVFALPGGLFQAGRSTRRMCIDQTRNLVLNDHIDAELSANKHGHYIDETVTFSRIDLSPPISPSLFEFQPSAGAKEIIRPIPPPITPSNTSPEPNAAAEPVTPLHPEYTQEAWDEGIQGKVTLEVPVDSAGTVGKIKVRESLGWGLDQKLIEAIRSTPFTPERQNGRSVDGYAFVELTFTLPDQRPAWPSSQPVSRPKHVRLPEVETKTFTEMDQFYLAIGVEFREPTVCALMDFPTAWSVGGWSPEGYQITDGRSECYYDIAALRADPGLCSLVVPIRKHGLDGSDLDKDHCLLQTNGTIPLNVGPPMAFAEIVQKLGYTEGSLRALIPSGSEPDRRTGWLDSQFPYFASLPNPPAAVIASDRYWKLVAGLAERGKAADRAEFLRRVKAPGGERK
jgi:TonB family protein